MRDDFDFQNTDADGLGEDEEETTEEGEIKESGMHVEGADGDEEDSGIVSDAEEM